MKLSRIYPWLAMILFLSGCSANQQDRLLQALVEYKRDSVGLSLQYKTVGDLQMAVLERAATKPADKSPTLVLLHGFSANKDTWLDFVANVDPRYRIIVPDLPGHGESESDLSLDYDLYLQARRLHQLLLGLGVTQHHLVGNSMGGGIALIYQQLYPEDLMSLTLMNAAGVSGELKSEYLQALDRGVNLLIPHDRHSFKQVFPMTMHAPAYIPWPLEQALMRRSINRQALNKKIFADMLQTQARLEDLGFTQNIAAAAKQQLPTLIIWGKNDRILDVSTVKALGELIPHAEVELYDSVGHLPMMEEPEKSAKRLNQFIAREKTD